MHSIQQVLDGVVRKHRWQRATTLLAIEVIWRSALGPPLSDATRPWSFHKGRLTVAVPSPVWTQELMYMRESLMSRINQQLQLMEGLEDDMVKEMRFTVRAWNREHKPDPEGGEKNPQAVARLKALTDQLKGGMDGERRRD